MTLLERSAVYLRTAATGGEKLAQIRRKILAHKTALVEAVRNAG